MVSSASLAGGAGNLRMSLSDALPTDWARIVEVLQPFVKDSRMDRLQRVVGSRRAGLHLVLENVHDPHNAAAVLRTAEGLGVQHVHIVESVNEFQVIPAGSSRGAQKGVAMGCSRWLSIRRYGSSLECVEALRAQVASPGPSPSPNPNTNTSPNHSPSPSPHLHPNPNSNPDSNPNPNPNPGP